MANDQTSIDLAAAAGPVGIDPRAYLRILWRRKLLLLAFLVVIPGGTYAYVSHLSKTYRSDALLQFTGSQSTVSSLFNPSSQSGPNLVADARLITTPVVARRAARYLRRPPAQPLSLLSQVSASGDPTTNFLTITATASSPHRAAAIANAFARAVVHDAAQSNRTNLRVAVAQLQTQLNGIPSNNPGRLQVASQLAQFRALLSVQDAGVSVIQAATPQPTPVSPRVMRSFILALIVALLLGLGAVALADAADRRLRDTHDVDRLVGVPLLSTVPSSAFSGGRSHPAEESFATLRAALTYFNVDKRISTVLVTSPAQAEGKTTVSVGLARALARAGADVILLDADMRRPAAAARLGLGQLGGGLGAVLIDELALDAALLEGSPGDFRGRLRVLPAGTPPPNPSELLGSRRMRDLLAELEERCDIVVIDSTPVLTVSDSIPLLPLVSGVTLVARMNQTSRDAIVKLREVVTIAGGHALGLVMTGARGAGLYAGYRGYRYGYGYAPAGQNGNGNRNGKVPRSRGGVLRRLVDREREMQEH